MTGREPLSALLKSVQTPLMLSVGVTGIVFLGTFGSKALQLRITTGLVLMVVVVGIYAFIGNSGVVSFGHISFMAIGGYTAAILTFPVTQKNVLLPDLPAFIRDSALHYIPAILLGGFVAVLFAVIVGYPLMRLSGIAAAIAMFALLIVVNTVIGEAEPITRGQKALAGIPFFTSKWVALIWVVIAIFVVFWFQNTRYGLRLRASREDEFGAKAVGVDIAKHRYIALILSAFFVGVGGALWGGLIGALTPEVFFIRLTFATIVMLVVGGMYSLSGAVVGAVTVTAVTEILREVESGFDAGPVSIDGPAGLRLLGVAILGLVIVLFRPSGLTGGKEVTVAMIRGWFGSRSGRASDAGRAA